MQTNCVHQNTHSYHEMTVSELCIEIVEKICMLALISFSATEYFGYFILGFAIGWTYRVICIIQGKENGEEMATGSHCSSDRFLENMAGISFPPIMRLGIEFLTLYCHVEHHGWVFAPLVGFSAGSWVGQHTVWVYRLGAMMINKKLGVQLPV